MYGNEQSEISNRFVPGGASRMRSTKREKGWMKMSLMQLVSLEKNGKIRTLIPVLVDLIVRENQPDCFFLKNIPNKQTGKEILQGGLKDD